MRWAGGAVGVVLGDGPQDVAAGEGRGLLGQACGAGQVRVELGHVAAVERRGPVAAERVQHRGRVPAGVDGPGRPLGLEGVGVDVVALLGPAGVERRQLGAAGAGLAPVGHGFDDLLAALGVGLDPLPGDARDLGPAVVDLGPLDAEALGELVAQDRLVEEAGGAGVLVDERAVQRPEAAVDALGHVGHQQVGVEVGIAGPAGAVAERGHGQAVPADALGAGVAAPGHGRVLLEVGDGLGRGRLVGGDDLGLDRGAAEGVEQRDRLRRRDGDVEAGHGGLAAARSHREQALAGGRVVAAEDELERLGVDLAGQGQVLGQAAVPSTGRFAGAEVVVLDAVGDGLQVVVVLARGELADAEHGAFSARSGSTPAGRCRRGG